MTNNKKIFMVITEEGNIIKGEELKDVWLKDQIVYDSEIEDLVETEMEECCHNDYIEDYETELDFYISNAKEESYKIYLEDTLDTIKLTDEAKEIIQDEVIDRIKARTNAIKLH